MSGASLPPTDGPGALEAYQQSKVRVCPSEAGLPVPWKLRRRLASFLSQLPPACLQEMTEAPGGFTIFWDGETGYHPGPWERHGCRAQGAALLDASAFLVDPKPALRALAGLLDHLLGSRCAWPARYISSGQPYSPRWRQFYHRLVAAQRLQYADDREARQSPEAYFRWAVAAYFDDAASLQATDPQAYRLLRSSLFSAAFWKGHPLRPRADNQGILCPQ